MYVYDGDIVFYIYGVHNPAGDALSPSEAC